MMMEVFLSEEKAKLHNIDIKKCYKIIDDYFYNHGVKKLSQGVYLRTDKDFGTISSIQTSLPRTNWFLKVVDEFYCRYEGDTIDYREDALEAYYKVRERNSIYD